MTFVIVVTSLRFYTAEILLGKHYYIFLTGRQGCTGTTSPVTSGYTSTQTVWDIWFYSLWKQPLLNTTFLTSHISEPVVAHLKTPHCPYPHSWSHPLPKLDHLEQRAITSLLMLHTCVCSSTQVFPIMSSLWSSVTTGWADMNRPRCCLLRKYMKRQIFPFSL